MLQEATDRAVARGALVLTLAAGSTGPLVAHVLRYGRAPAAFSNVLYLLWGLVSTSVLVGMMVLVGLAAKQRANRALLMSGGLLGVVNVASLAIVEALQRSNPYGMDLDTLLQMASVVVGLGAVVGFVYALALMPAVIWLRKIRARPTCESAVAVRSTVGAYLVMMSAFFFWFGADPWIMGAAAVGFVIGFIAVLSAYRKNRALLLMAGGGDPRYVRVAASSVDGLDPHLPPLFAGVSDQPEYLLMRLEGRPDSPYRGGVQGVPYARVD
ncbi:MAG: hypothetical protein AB8I08_08750 [Sandaracinaceae bacterium]